MQRLKNRLPTIYLNVASICGIPGLLIFTSGLSMGAPVVTIIGGLLLGTALVCIILMMRN